ALARAAASVRWGQHGCHLVSRAGIGLCLANRLGEDLVGRLDPGERAGAGVPLTGEAFDRGGQGTDVLEAAPPDRLAGEDAEPRLDLVHPRRRGRREVEREATVATEPGLDVGRLVGADIVEDDVNLAGRV